MSEPAPKTDPITRAARRRRLLVRLAVVALVVLGVVASSWYALFFWAKSSGRLERWVTRRPDKFQLRYNEIASPWPFVFEAEELVVAARTRRVSWEVLADRARVTIDPLALLDRRLVLRACEVSGAVVHVVRAAVSAPAEGEAARAAPRQLPPIGAFADAPAKPPAPNPRPWSWIVSDLAFDNLREIWIDETRVTGIGTGELALALRRREWAEIEPSRLRLENARVTLGAELLGERLDGEIELQVLPWRYKGAKVVEVSRHAQGRVKLAGDAEIAGALRYLFGERPWLDLAADRAEIQTELAFDRGRLRTGSKLQAVLAPSIGAFGFVASGPAALAAEVTGERDSERVESRLALGRWTLGRPNEPAIFVGEGLRVEAVSESPRTDRPPTEYRLDVDLGEGRADDLRFVSELVPKAAELAVESGALSLGGRLGFDSAGRTGAGNIALKGEGLALRAKGQRFAADFAADLALSGADLAAGAFSLDGSKLALKNVAAKTSAGGRVADWWAEVDVVAGRIALRKPFESSGTLRARAADSRPVVAFYELKRDLPSWAERALLVENVQLEARYRVAPGVLELDDILLPLPPNGEARAEVELKREHRHARLLLTWRRFDLGVEIVGAKRDLRLINAREWFERGATAKSHGKP